MTHQDTSIVRREILGTVREIGKHIRRYDAEGLDPVCGHDIANVYQDMQAIVERLDKLIKQGEKGDG